MFYGWWILILGAMINGIGLGITYHSFTIFFLPLKRDLGVSSAAISLLYGAARLEGGVEGPVVGYLIDRFGPAQADPHRLLSGGDRFYPPLHGAGLSHLFSDLRFPRFPRVQCRVLPSHYDGGQQVVYPPPGNCLFDHHRLRKYRQHDPRPDPLLYHSGFRLARRGGFCGAGDFGRSSSRPPSDSKMPRRIWGCNRTANRRPEPPAEHSFPREEKAGKEILR